MPKPNPKLILPGSIRDFVARQATLPVETFLGNRETPDCPYGQYWLRAVAAMLLSGRIAPKADDFPNMTDVNRICKEANFDQYLFETTSQFLVAAEIIRPNEQESGYKPGKYSKAYWNHEFERLREAARHGFLELVQRSTPVRVWRVTFAFHSSLDSLVALFAAAFEGLAIPNEQAGRIFLGFSKLPSADLIDLGKRLGFKDLEYEAASWDGWLDEPGQKALLAALYGSDWAYTADHRKQEWMFLSDTARIILGLLAPPELPPPVLDFKVLPNFCVLAGADLPHEKLVPLFRHCKIKRIDRVFEFELNKRQLVETSSRSSASKLEKVLEESGPLPATVESLLSQRPRVGGEIRIRGCSAIVQPESAEVLDAIRQHSHLKGYLATGAPKGYLLIKQGSNPNNFVNRCEQLGFRINILQS